MKRKNKALKTNTKIIILILSLAFLIFLYIARLFYLQILDPKDYKDKGDAISKIGREIVPTRGNIYDRNGNPLAISQRIESLYLLSATTEEESSEAEKIIQDELKFNDLSQEDKDYYTKIASLPIYREEDISKLSKILNIDEDVFYNLLNSNKEGIVYDSLNNSQKEQIDILNLDYIMFISSNDRYYPNNEILASTIGFLDDDGTSYGLENYYNDILSGEKGYQNFYKALRGTEIPYTDNNNLNPVEANNLVTTINLDIQKILYENMKDAIFKFRPMSISAVIMDPNNGEVLAMETLPSFDLNNPRNLTSEVDNLFLNEMKDEQFSNYLLSRWQNKAVSQAYEPGSVFKSITASVALESDNSLKNKIYQDNGFYELAKGVIIKSWRYWDPFGPQDMREAFKNSTNPVFVQIAKDVGKENYIEYSKPFRFGVKTQIDLPNEVSGFYPSNPKISDVNFGTMSYGYYMRTTPIQILSALNSIVNGGKYYKPHIGKEISNINDNILYSIPEEYVGTTISKQTSDEMNDFFEYTAENYGLNTDVIKFGAKTGSTNKYQANSIFNKNEDKSGIYASIFVSYPAKNPKYTLLIMLDEPQIEGTASVSALPTAKNIMYDLVEYDTGRPIEVEIDDLVDIPNLEGYSVEEAFEITKDLGLKLSSNVDIGRFDLINSQYPKAGNQIEKNSPIAISTDEKIKMPLLIGKKIDETIELLDLNGLKYSIEGKGKYVVNQSISQGEAIDKTTNIIIEIGENNE